MSGSRGPHWYCGRFPRNGVCQTYHVSVICGTRCTNRTAPEYITWPTSWAHSRSWRHVTTPHSNNTLQFSWAVHNQSRNVYFELYGELWQEPDTWHLVDKNGVASSPVLLYSMHRLTRCGVTRNPGWSYQKLWEMGKLGFWQHDTKRVPFARLTRRG